MIRTASLVVAFVSLTACSESSTATNEATPAAEETVDEAVASASAEVTAPSGYKTGQNLVVLREAKCVEEGPKAGEPWDMKKGAFVAWVADVGPNLRVDTGLGLNCLIARDAVGPT